MSSPYNIMISTIKSVASGNDLSEQEQSLADSLNQMLVSYPITVKGMQFIKNQSLGFASKKWIETGDLVFAGKIVFTGVQEFTGSVNLVTLQTLENSLQEFHGSSPITLSNLDYCEVKLSSNNQSDLKNLYYITNNTSNAYFGVNLTGTIEVGRVRKFSIISSRNSTISYLGLYKLNSGSEQSASVGILNTLIGSCNYSISDVTVFRIDDSTLRVFVNVSYL